MSTPISKLVIIAASMLSLSVWGLEPWADQKLPVRDDLELWLDASRREVITGSRLMIPGGPLDIWQDASGNKRHVRQPVARFRPRFLGNRVRFDGEDDFLSCAGLTNQFKEAMIFISVAPQTNAGNLRGIVSFSESGANDYSTGLNIDLGPQPTRQFDFINVESRGAAGIENLSKTAVPFGEPRVISLTAQSGTNGIQLWLNGARQGSRARNGNQHFSFYELVIGSRFYSNALEPPHVQGFFDGEIFDVLIYSRVLSDTERASVEKFLIAKSAAPTLEGRKISPLETVKNPPPVQMFLPGFSARELPVKLNNLNNVKYREDGKLVALGYDGTISLLTDTDGDGVEDKAATFWNKRGFMRSPIGMALTPPNYARGVGVFVASKGKVSLIVDTNHDDVADEEIIVAQGWKEGWHNVDGLGVAVAKDGSIYFGIGCANFADAYLRDKNTGMSAYRLDDDHGTIQKVSPDFSKREVVCTGIRFPVAMAFNPAGDLFCTDQEGATWLPNGNPFDELLHIQPNRHYGFPPRHPKYLPGVIDEPSVFDYAPQHESTCGLNFNVPVNGGKTFGPSWWRGDAFVTGFSRGKLWRTKLAKTSAGYVAQTQLIGCFNMMPSDACVSPNGDLVVTMHSGQPDWGSGPTGEGKLFKISFTNAQQPQPVLVWPSSPTETSIEFDRPMSAEQAKDFAKQIKIVQGRYATAGDQFESLRPGYQIVQNQLAEPRYELEIHSVALENNGRTVVIRNAPRKLAVHYAVSLQRENDVASTQYPSTDLVHDLCGVEATWSNAEKSNAWTGWLPHLDLAVARQFTEASGQHDALWRLCKQSGELKLHTQLDLWQMLHPAVQPGSKLDYEYPPETVTVIFKANIPLKISSASAKIERASETESRLPVSPKQDSWIDLEANLQTGTDIASQFEVSWFTSEDSRLRTMPVRRFLLPWAVAAEEISPTNTERVIPEITGGNWLAGKKLFFGEQQACAKCHFVRGEGGRNAPDLSNLIHRDYASVMKDITQPSAAINPDHVAYNIELKSGDALTGISIGGGEKEILLGDASGNITKIAKEQIASMKPSTISLMPEGLLNGLSQQQTKDLLAFLLTTPLEPATLEIQGEPPPRTRAEVNSIFNVGVQTGKSEKQFRELKILLASGPKDHGPSEHDYPLWQKRWSKLLALAENVTVQTTANFPSSQQLANADIVVFYSNNPGWASGSGPEMDKFFERGGGAVFIHYAVDGHTNVNELAGRIGLAWRGGASKFRHGALDLKFSSHEITKGFDQLHLVDESYWNLIGNETNVQVLASGDEEGGARPLIWTREQGKGRVFVSIPGHYTWTFDDPLFRLLLLRGMAWTAREPVNRFDELATIGARVTE